MDDYRARYYDPNTGRFLSEDPAGFGGSGPNLYAYAFDSPTNFIDPTGLDGWTSFWGGARAVGGGFEAAAGAGLAFGTGWTGIGAVAGVGIGLHGLDQVQAGLRQMSSGCSTDSLTSQGLQAAGLSQSSANLVDTGLSVAGSAGAGIASAAREAGGVGNILYYEIGQQTVSSSNWANYGQIADPVERGMQMVSDMGWLRALAPDLGGASQLSTTIPKGLTPLAPGGVGALLGGAAGLAGRGGCGCVH